MTDTEYIQVPDLLGDADYVLKVRASGIPDVLAGDHVTVTVADTAPDGRVIVAKNGEGEHAVVRTPLGDGWAVVGVVVGLMRRLDVD